MSFCGKRDVCWRPLRRRSTLVLARHREIIAIVTPTLREETRGGWSPVMPLCPQCGQINSTLVTAYHPDRANGRVFVRA